MEIWVDHRERELKQLWTDAHVQGKQLELGDVLFAHQQHVLCIFERKTAGDLSSSVIDGRYLDQKKRLQAFANEHHVPVVYILEGCTMLRHNDDRLSPQSLAALKTAMLFDPDIKVVYTDDVHQTIAFLQGAFEHVSSHRNAGDCPKATMDDIMCMKKNRLITSTNLFRLQLAQIPGVSIKLSQVIASAFDQSAVAFFAALAHSGQEAMAQRLAALSTRPNRTIGSKVAHKILQYIQ